MTSGRRIPSSPRTHRNVAVAYSEHTGHTTTPVVLMSPVTPRPYRSEANCPSGRAAVRTPCDQDFLASFLPILGKRFFTAALTFFCSAGVPFWATRVKALRVGGNLTASS